MGCKAQHRSDRQHVLKGDAAFENTLHYISRSALLILPYLERVYDLLALSLACTPVQAAFHRFERIPIAPQRGCVEIVNTFLGASRNASLRGTTAWVDR
jgi:hypothetical protein